MPPRLGIVGTRQGLVVEPVSDSSNNPRKIQRIKMQIIINATQAELDAMNVSETELKVLVLERVDSMTHKKQKIFHQVELGAELNIVKESK
jgi:hypothetical protein